MLFDLNLSLKRPQNDNDRLLCADLLVSYVCSSVTLLPFADFSSHTHTHNTLAALWLISELVARARAIVRVDFHRWFSRALKSHKCI